MYVDNILSTPLLALLYSTRQFQAAASLQYENRATFYAENSALLPIHDTIGVSSVNANVEVYKRTFCIVENSEILIADFFCQSTFTNAHDM